MQVYSMETFWKLKIIIYLCFQYILNWHQWHLTKEIIEASYQSLDKIQSTIKVGQWLAMSHDFKYRARDHLKIHFLMVKKFKWK